ncbi:unnamed protein product [Allacma fusca]|uniref:Uncharacterized protein n=1 Tax=Allacma fusca TaxID=39272 RepID=A0A8J2JDG1_9HEXA|nr:unnamed protein product [Allacma fusca]
MLTAFWFDSCHHDKIFYIGRHTQQVDKTLFQCRVPYDYDRTIRTILHRKFWKATEWRTWMFVSTTILKGILPEVYRSHLLRLSNSLMLLSDEKITPEDLLYCEENLSSFAQQTEVLYGLESCTFNLHILTHAATCVKNWGPLWSYSAFQYENFNGLLGLICQHSPFVLCIETTVEIEGVTGADENMDGPEGGTYHRPKCPVGHFECLSDSSLCVPQASICNSRADCPDNSDEAGCHNQHDKNFWDSLFYKRPGEEVEDMEEVTCKYKLAPNPEVKVAGELLLPGKEKEIGERGKKLRFSRTSRKIEDMEENKMSSKQMSPAWDSMVSDDWVASTEAEWETECLCVSEKLFCQNLHSANLSSIPRDVEFLDLDGSLVNLQDFSRIDFPQLESLILSRGFIEEIHPGAFSRLRKLATLHLTNNRLSSIPSETFVGSPNLHSLFLGYNQLTSLHSDSFAGLTSLRELDLRHNKISEIPTDVFAPLVFLRKLHLSHNEVKSISSVLFQGLNRLEMLSLSGNSIATIHEGTFENLTSLQGLFLSWNKLTVLEDRTFCNLHSLLNLNLKDNEIVRIDPGAFTCLNRLESLYASSFSRKSS